MGNKFKNIIFDWSGVISDNQASTFRVVNGILEHFGTKPVSYKTYKKEWRQPFMNFYNKYLPSLTLDEEIEAYKKIYQKVIKLYPPTPFPGIVQLINQCRQNKNLFIVSSDYKDYLLKEIKSFGFENVFKEVVASVHDKEEGLRRLILDYKLEPNKTIFIGDTAHEIEVGKKVGIKTAGVTWGIYSEERLKKSIPDLMIHNLKELEPILLN